MVKMIISRSSMAMLPLLIDLLRTKEGVNER
jgi:hypothetical protein